MQSSPAGPGFQKLSPPGQDSSERGRLAAVELSDDEESLEKDPDSEESCEEDDCFDQPVESLDAYLQSLIKSLEQLHQSVKDLGKRIEENQKKKKKRRRRRSLRRPPASADAAEA